MSDLTIAWRPRRRLIDLNWFFYGGLLALSLALAIFCLSLNLRSQGHYGTPWAKLDASVQQMPGETKRPPPLYALGGIVPVSQAPANCPQGTADPNDGCTGASNAPVQHSNFFTGYTGTNYGANRPSWNVAGVDYAVGWNSNGAALITPTAGNAPAGFSFNTGTQVATCNGANATLSGFDMTGWQIQDNGSCTGTLTVTNNNFAVNSFSDTHFFNSFGQLSNVATVVWTHNTMDGVGCTYTTDSSTFINYSVANGHLTFEYNYPINAATQMIVMSQTSGTTSGYTIKWNMFEIMNYASGAHGQTAAPSVGTPTWGTFTYDYNTAYQVGNGGTAPAIGACSSGGTLAGGWTGFAYNAPNSPGVITLADMQKNSLVMAGNGTPAGAPLRCDGSGTETTCNFENNFIDPTNASAIFTGAGASAGTCSGNKKLTDGSAITGTFGNLTCS